MVLSNGLKEEHEALFSRKFICVKQQDFYIKRQLSYKNIFCKKTAFLHKKAAFLQKYISVKKQVFYNRSICKKAGFLHKKSAVLQKYINFCKKTVFLQPLNL